ncbi:MAG: E3 binding domain-containing protein [Candidatus Moduliflexus flocculans]|nr:E3 binding domain-containing protein [Candidatus Moduliflexus flocculans]
METDKATVEMEAYTNGAIRKLDRAPRRQFVKVGDLIAIIGAPDEDISAPAAGSRGAAAPAAAPAAASPRPRPAGAGRPCDAARPRSAPARRPGAALKASPLALRMAAEAGLDLGALQGTGPQGRIIKRDIEAALARRRAAAPARPAAPQRSRSLSLVAAREAGPEPGRRALVDAPHDREAPGPEQGPGARTST